MADFLFDESGDISLVAGKFVLTASKKENIRQRLLLSLSINKGNWIFNTEFGTPWLKNDTNDLQLLGKTPKNIVDAVIQQVILDTDGVLSLDSYSSTVDKLTGKIVINSKITVEDGVIHLSSVAIG